MIPRLDKLRKPICGFVAYSGTGKTSLLEKLIPKLRDKNLRIGLIKHAHHDFDIDYEGKDSYRLRKAGATETLVASSNRWALIHEHQMPQEEPDLNTLVGQLNQDDLDIILVEGFKHQHFPRIELYRKSLGKPLLFPEDDSILAIATDEPLVFDSDIIQLDLNNTDAIVTFLVSEILK